MTDIFEDGKDNSEQTHETDKQSVLPCNTDSNSTCNTDTDGNSDLNDNEPTEEADSDDISLNFDIEESDLRKKHRTQITNLLSTFLLVVSACLILYAFFSIVDVSKFHLFADTNALRVDVVTQSGETRSLLNTKYSDEYAEQAREIGVYDSIVFSNGYSKPITVTVYCDTALIVPSDAIVIKDDSFSLSIPKKSDVSVSLSETTGIEMYGFVTAIEQDVEAYVAAESALNSVCNDNTVTKISLIDNITASDNVVFCYPCTFSSNGKKLTVSGNIVIDTDEVGAFTIITDTQESISAHAFFAESENCDVVFHDSPFSYDNDMDFFIYAKTYNGIPMLHDTYVVTSANRMAMLCSNNHYPTLRRDCIVELRCSDLASGVDYVFEIDVPVTLNVFCDIGLYDDDVDIRMITADEGDITINVPDGIKQNGSITVTAPNCTLSWVGSSIPSAEYVAKYMNVKSFNGTNVSKDFELGGTGSVTTSYISALESNNSTLGDNVFWTVRGNTLCSSFSYFVNESALQNAVVDVKTDTTAAKIEFNAEAMNPDGTINMLLATRLTVTDSNGNTRKYAIESERVIHNIPVISINVNDGSDIVDKETYKEAEFSLASDNPNLAVESAGIRIKGRGQSSWNSDKKPYKIKFDYKTSLLGMVKAKNYVLISCYLDKALIRNYIATKLALQLTNLSFTVKQYPVDLFLNGEYKGVYILSEQIEVKRGRIELSEPNTADTGFLLELAGVGGNPDYALDVNFFHSKILKFVTIKHPEPLSVTPEQLAFIKNYCIAADEAIITGEGYDEYIDVDSVIDWFILHELTFNSDCCFRRSTFFTKDAGGKLSMGPIWDFDLAFGNFTKDTENYETWASVGSEGGYVGISWINYLMESESFRTRLRERFDEIGPVLLETAFDTMDTMESVLEPSYQDNFRIWDINRINMPNVPQGETSLSEQFDYIRDFLQNRYDWINANL